MEAYIAEIGHFVRTHQGWAGVIVGLISFGESLVLAGLLIPATAIMLVIGGLVGTGVLDPVTVLVGAILGAIVGDIVSYALGRWLGPGIVHRKPLRRYRHAVAKTRLFFRKYGFAAVLVGRFLGPIRSTVPLVAGMMAMNQVRFQIANVLSAVLWAPLMLAPGWIGARGLSELEWVGGEHMLAVVALVIVVTGIGTAYIGKHLAKRAKPQRVRAAAQPGL
ncbi:DedA family protein [Aureimonas sp. AU40]|uniref:DedA family protein n=1 Tax=Aureimonas sp. AU40 TaxID=1637747 RepID=UPI000783DC9C|nr:DedA family protein [Aureimonas sp. AU40]